MGSTYTCKAAFIDNEALLGEGGGVCRGVGYIPVSIQPIFVSFVAISSCLVSLFQGHFACQNFNQISLKNACCYNTLYYISCSKFCISVNFYFSIVLGYGNVC